MSGGVKTNLAQPVIKIMSRSSRGSAYQIEPSPPFQPNRPAGSARPSRLVTTDMPNPQP
jgi:hypothetical protein